HFHNFSVPVLEAEKTLVKKAEKILDKGKSDLEQSLKQFRFASQNLIRENRIEITNYSRQLKSSSFLLLKQSTESLSQSSRQVSILSPKNILKRGFSITYVNGKALMSASEVQKDQEVITVLADGKISSIVKEINSKDDE